MIAVYLCSLYRVDTVCTICSTQLDNAVICGIAVTVVSVKRWGGGGVLCQGCDILLMYSVVLSLEHVYS